MMSEQVMSPGVCVVDVWVELLSGGQVGVRAELSDGIFLHLNRTDEEFAQMMKRLVDLFLDDREMLSSNLLTGLLKVRAAGQTSDPETKIMEMNKLLKSVINLPHKFSQSEAVLAFFEPSAMDRTFRQTENQILQQEEDQTRRQEAENQTVRQEQDWTVSKENQDLSVFQSPVGLSEIMMSNGFCLANTETILFDLTPPTHPLVTQSDDFAGRRDDGQTGEEAELETQVGPPSLFCPVHLLLTWTQETDILD